MKINMKFIALNVIILMMISTIVAGSMSAINTDSRANSTRGSMPTLTNASVNPSTGTVLIPLLPAMNRLHPVGGPWTL